MKKEPNYYAILGVEPDATAEEINEAARQISDRFPESVRDPAENPAYRQLVTAYEVLSDPERRAAYDAAWTTRSEELTIAMQASRNAIPPVDGEQLLYILATISAPQRITSAHQPLNLCLVFDRSTSMRGERLQQVKAAARHLIETLSQEDLISIVSFSDRAEVLVPSGHINNRQLLIHQVHRAEASGGTEIYQGLSAGVREVSRAVLPRYINQLILLTDGQTYGDEAQCMELAQQAAARGITLSAFGIGTDWNDKFLDQLVAPSGGHSAFIEQPEQIVARLQEQVEGMGERYAHDVRLTPNAPAGVRCAYAIKLAPFAQPLPIDTEINLGAVEVGKPLSVLLEFAVGAQKVGSQVEIPLNFQALIPSRQSDPVRLHRRCLLWVVPGEPERPPPSPVLRAVEMMTLYRMNEKAWDELQSGQTDIATRRLQRLTTRLMDAGHTQLAQLAMMETQRLARVGELSAEGRKKLKYGTRSLLTAAMVLRSDDSMH